MKLRTTLRFFTLFLTSFSLVFLSSCKNVGEAEMVDDDIAELPLPLPVASESRNLPCFKVPAVLFIEKKHYIINEGTPITNREELVKQLVLTKRSHPNNKYSEIILVADAHRPVTEIQKALKAVAVSGFVRIHFATKRTKQSLNIIRKCLTINFPHACPQDEKEAIPLLIELSPNGSRPLVISIPNINNPKEAQISSYSATSLASGLKPSAHIILPKSTTIHYQNLIDAINLLFHHSITSIYLATRIEK